MKTSKKIASRAAAAALGLSLALGLASTAQAGQSRFTFRGVEFIPSDEQRTAAVQAFVAEQLPSGLPIPEAISRLRKADAACEAHPQANAQLKCQFTMLVHPTGLELGAVYWTVRLTQDSQGLLANATVERSTTV
jgi:hypothetical protein